METQHAGKSMRLVDHGENNQFRLVVLSFEYQTFIFCRQGSTLFLTLLSMKE